VNLPKPWVAGAAGGGWRRSSISKFIPSDIASDLPLPRWGALSGKSRCTSRRWWLFFVQLLALRIPEGRVRQFQVVSARSVFA
jgi:hypothetical protein